MNIANVSMLDITSPDQAVEVEIDQYRRVLYVHVDGVTVLRICRIPDHLKLVEHTGGKTYKHMYPSLVKLS